MSCYDQVYGKDRSIKDLLIKAKKAGKKSVWIRQKNKIIQNTRTLFLNFKKKYAFYSTYRGSLKKIFVRGLNALRRNIRVNKTNNHTDLIKITQKIQDAKKILKREQRKYR